MLTRITPNTNTFYAVNFTENLLQYLFDLKQQKHVFSFINAPSSLSQYREKFIFDFYPGSNNHTFLFAIPFLIWKMISHLSFKDLFVRFLLKADVFLN